MSRCDTFAPPRSTPVTAYHLTCEKQPSQRLVITGQFLRLADAPAARGRPAPGTGARHRRHIAAHLAAKSRTLMLVSCFPGPFMILKRIELLENILSPPSTMSQLAIIIVCLADIMSAALPLESEAGMTTIFAMTVSVLAYELSTAWRQHDAHFPTYAPGGGPGPLHPGRVQFHR